MIQASREEVTGLLRAWSDGDQAALEKLIPLVYAELHRLAKRYMGHEHAGHSLQTSALVNEAYLRLVDAHGVRWQNRTQLFFSPSRWPPESCCCFTTGPVRKAPSRAFNS